MLLLFNSALVRETRQRESIRQAEFAKFLGVSEAYLSMLEKGQREPSLALVRKLVGVTEIPVEKWLSVNPQPEGEKIPCMMKNSARAVAAAQSRLRREHLERRRAEERIWELEQANERLMAENCLRECFEDIMRDESLSKSEKQRKQEKLVRWTMEEGEFTAEEIRAVLKMKHSDFRQSPRELADIRYRARKGLTIPDDVFYMDMRKKQKR